YSSPLVIVTLPPPAPLFPYTTLFRSITTAFICPYTSNRCKKNLYGTDAGYLVGGECSDSKHGWNIKQHRILDDGTTDSYHPRDEGTDESDQKYNDYKSNVH